MIYLFLGSDDFSKRRRLQLLARGLGAEVITLRAEDGPLDLAQLAEPMLFGGARLFVVENFSARLDPEIDLSKLAGSPHTIVLVEQSMDKRKKTTTQWLKYPDITVEEFNAPQGKDLQKWLLEQAGELGAQLQPAVADYLIAAILPPISGSRFAEPVADLNRLDNELRKLTAYADGQAITKEMVDSLVARNTDVETWDIVNALADRNMKKAFVALEQFFADDASADEKSKTIQLNSVLADQFRSILLAQDFLEQRAPDSSILERTGWKSGRLFIMKKLAGKFKTGQLISVLDKLERLDIELKSTTTPGQVILQLIAAQLA
jgi:DNA polymerase III delta subunit